MSSQPFVMFYHFIAIIYLLCQKLVETLVSLDASLPRIIQVIVQFMLLSCHALNDILHMNA